MLKEVLWNHEYAVIYKEKVHHYINPRLAITRGLSSEDLDALRNLHVLRLEIYDAMAETDDCAALAALVVDLEQAEFAMQRVWRFSEDRNFHRWFDAPRCICPKLDNQDNLGTDRRIVDCECPIHGRLPEFAQTSADWAETVQDLVLIVDPDGWDRSSFDKSWSELILKSEFINRVNKSSISFTNLEAWQEWCSN